IRERIAQQTLQHRAGAGEGCTDERGSQHAWQPQLADDRAAGRIAAEERGHDVAGSDRDRPDEDPRDRARHERGREDHEDDREAHYRKSSGWTMRAYASAASPTRGPGRLMSAGSIVPIRLFFTAVMTDQPARAAIWSGFAA